MMLFPTIDLSFNLRSCDKEVLKPLRGQSGGQIPTWLNGTLLINGPGTLKVGDMEVNHVFDGPAMLRRFHIENGEVTFQSKYVQSKAFLNNQRARKIIYNEFGTRAVPDPCRSIFNRFLAVFKNGDSLSDNSAISVYPFGDEFYTFTEIPIIHRIDHETLDTTKRVDLSKHSSIASQTAHPHVMENGDVYNLGVSITAKGSAYTIVRYPNNNADMFSNPIVAATIPSRWRFNPSYMHTFGITENYFVVVEQPMAISLWQCVKIQLVRNASMSSILRLYNNKSTLFHVVRRSDGQIARTFEADAFVYFHLINQYEEDGHLVVDICCHKDASVINNLYVESLKNYQTDPNFPETFRGKPKRFVLPLDGDKVTLERTNATARKTDKKYIHVTPEELCSDGCELPRINYDKYMGRPYRYFYGMSYSCDVFGGLVKVDTETKTAKLWHEGNCYLSEPIFVPNPDAKGEDDGVILSSMVWGKERDHDAGILVLDARTMTELGRTTFTLPSPLGCSLHGWYRPATLPNIVHE